MSLVFAAAVGAFAVVTAPVFAIASAFSFGVVIVVFALAVVTVVSTAAVVTAVIGVAVATAVFALASLLLLFLPLLFLIFCAS